MKDINRVGTREELIAELEPMIPKPNTHAVLKLSNTIDTPSKWVYSGSKTECKQYIEDQGTNKCIIMLNVWQVPATPSITL